MSWHRYEIKSTWQGPVTYGADSDWEPREYDFQSFCLEVMDVIWAWAFAAGVVLFLALLFFF